MPVFGVKLSKKFRKSKSNRVTRASLVNARPECPPVGAGFPLTARSIALGEVRSAPSPDRHRGREREFFLRVDSSRNSEKELSHGK